MHETPQLLVDLDAPRGGRYWASISGASLIVHVFLGLAVLWILSLPAPPRRQFVNIDVQQRPQQVTQLIAPPSQITQTDPNRGKLSQEFNLSSLTPRPSSPSTAAPGAAALPRQAAPPKFVPPNPRAVPNPTTAMAEAPTIDAGQLRASNAPPPAIGIPAPVAPPPKIQPEENPKLAFERPGAPTGQTGGVGRIPTPRNTVEEAAKQVARGAAPGRIIIGDEEEGSITSPNSPIVPLPGKMGSSVELLSDPTGVDFRPYLERVLSSVRRNWFAIIPESALLGRAGRVYIQFAIAKDGTVPKLVIAVPSGAEALDRAAVAGISASNPFPPLPADFKGSQIRLQLAFKYNMR